MMAQRCRLKRRPQTTDQIPETESVSAEEAGANEEQEEPPAEVSNEGTEGNVEGEASTEGDVPAGDEGTASTTPDVVPSESPAAENAEPETPAPEAVETPAPEAVETPVPSDASNEAQEAPQAPANGLEEAGPAPAPSVSPVPSEEPVKVSYTVKYLDKATGEAVYPETTGEAAVGDTIAIEAHEVPGYTLCADQPTELELIDPSTAPAAVTLAEGVENEQTAPNTVVVYYEAATPETAEQTLTGTAGSATATVTATVPKGVTVKMEALGENIEDYALQALAEATNGAEIKNIEAYEISLVNTDGSTYTLPEGQTATVVLSGVSLQPGEGELVNAIHANADSSYDTGIFAEDGSNITFTVKSFSPFVVATTADTDATSASNGMSDSLVSNELDGSAEDADAATPVTLSTGNEYTILVGATLQIVGTSGGKWDSWEIASGSSYITLKGSGSAATIKGKSAGTATVTHTWHDDSWASKSETFTVNVQNGEEGYATAYFYAVRPNSSVTSTEDEAFFFVGTGVIDVKNLYLPAGQHITEGVADRIVQSPNDDEIKRKIAQIYEVAADDVEISYSYYKIGYAEGAPGFNVDKPDTQGEDLVDTAKCYHVDMNVTVSTPNKFSYNFYVKQPNASEYGASVQTAMLTAPATIPQPDSNKVPAEKNEGGVLYKFDGWYTDSECKNLASEDDFKVPDKVESGKLYDFYGRYVPAQVTVTYDANGGKLGEVPASNTVPIGNYTISNKSPSKENYTFLGWKINGSGELLKPEATIDVTQNITLVAQWAKTGSTITVEVKVQNVNEELQRVAASDYLNTPTNWTDGGGTDNFEAIYGNNVYTINYTYAALNCADIQLTLKDDKLAGYTVSVQSSMEGPTTAEDGTGKQAKLDIKGEQANWTLDNVPGNATVTVTLTQKSKDLKATVDYKLGENVQTADHKDLTATVSVLQPDTLSTEGVEAKTYTGWKLDKITINGEEVESLPETVSNGDAVVYNYVVDEEQTYNVNYIVAKGNENFGSVTPAQEQDQVLSNSKITGSKATANPGYAFDGWYKDDVLITRALTLSADDAVANLSTNPDTGVYADTTYTAHFDVDVKGDPSTGDPEDEGDDVPDKYQTIFKFVSGGNGTVTGDTYEKYEDIGNAKPTVSPVAAVQVAANDGYAFDCWTDNEGTVYWNLDAIKAVSTSNDLTFTAHFAVDEKGGGDDGEDPDGIPDKDQVKVTFDVVNGTWTEGGNGQKFAYLTLIDENGNRSEDGSATVTLPGTEPNNGYSNGVWTPADTKVTKDSEHAFVCTYAIRTDLSYTVRYLEDGTGRELNGAKVVNDQTFGTIVTESAINIPGYTMTSDKNPQSITIGTGDNVITFYYK